MNERIRELAEQATIKSVSENFIGEKFEIVTPSKEWAEKFAELIVRECAKLADESTSRPFQSYGIMIKEHFGVKE